MNNNDPLCLTTRHFLPQWGLEHLGVRTYLSTRRGGVSEGAYGSLNLGLHVGDMPERVAQNRQIYAQLLGASPVFLNQVHGCRVLELIGPAPVTRSTSASALDTTPPESADAAWTQQRGVACTMMVADCMPVLLADSWGRAVAAVHVGWRGLVGLRTTKVAHELEASGGVIAQSLQALRLRLFPPASRPPHAAPQPVIFAWLGPCIGPTAFEVGPEVRAWFVERCADNARAFKPSAFHAGKWMAHLPGLVQLELERLGVQRLFGNLAQMHTPTQPQVPDPWCTVTNTEDFFSYRRQGVCGRFAASIWLDEPQPQPQPKPHPPPPPFASDARLPEDAP